MKNYVGKEFNNLRVKASKNNKRLEKFKVSGHCIIRFKDPEILETPLDQVPRLKTNETLQFWGPTTSEMDICEDTTNTK